MLHSSNYQYQRTNMYHLVEVRTSLIIFFYTSLSTFPRALRITFSNTVNQQDHVTQQ